MKGSQGIPLRAQSALHSLGWIARRPTLASQSSQEHRQGPTAGSKRDPGESSSLEPTETDLGNGGSHQGERPEWESDELEGGGLRLGQGLSLNRVRRGSGAALRTKDWATQRPDSNPPCFFKFLFYIRVN